MIPWTWLIEGAKTKRGYMEDFLPMGFSLPSTFYYIHFINYGLIKVSLCKLINYGLINISLFYVFYYNSLLALDIGLFVRIK